MNKGKSYLTKRVDIFSKFLLGFSLLLIIIIFAFEMLQGGFCFAASFSFVAWLVFAFIYYKLIYVPYKQAARLLRLFIQGYKSQRVHGISPELEAAFEKFHELIDTPALINMSIKQAEYLALQNQINPHFLYNTLEGIRGEALCSGMDSIAEMTEALATFFRYTISNVEKLVTLEDELENIENYYIIQQYRFGDRLSLAINLDREDAQKVLQYRLPKLTLQPIIENSIYHGLEPKLGNGNLHIKVETSQSRLIITVSDDGIGFEEERLNQLNKALNTISLDYVKPDTERRGGIAIINVNSRIKLLFGEEYGIYIYSTPGAGTDVEITLPIITEDGRAI